jgi:hypothetical protein
MALHSVSWPSMVFNGLPWCSMALHGLYGPPRCSMAVHVVPWCSMALHGPPWCSMAFIALQDPLWPSLFLHGVQWCSMAFYGLPWPSMALLAVPWTSMALHRTLKRYWPHCTLFGSLYHGSNNFYFPLFYLGNHCGFGGTNCSNADHCYFEIRILSKHDL